MTDAELAKAHAKVREVLAHHGIPEAHTALVADLIYGVEDIVVPAYKAEMFARMQADTTRATEAEGEAFTHGYFCAEQESADTTQGKITELETALEVRLQSCEKLSGIIAGLERQIAQAGQPLTPEQIEDFCMDIGFTSWSEWDGDEFQAMWTQLVRKVEAHHFPQPPQGDGT